MPDIPAGRGGGAGRAGGGGATPPAESHLYTVAKGKTLTVNTPGLKRGEPLMATTVLDAPPTHGTVAIKPDGSFIYTPKGDFVGNDTFTYKIVRGTVTTPAGTITVVVSASSK
jgi:hypothetical protein